MVKIYRTKVLAVAAVLPLKLNRKLGITLEIQLAQYVTTVFALDGTLPRSEEPSLVFEAEYSHFRSSLWRWVAV